MFKRLAATAALVVMLNLAGCATAPKPHQFQSAFQIDRAFADVWTATLDALTEHEFPIASIEKESGIIITDWISGMGTNKEGYCDCGSAGIFIEEKRLGKFTIYIKSLSAASTEVRSTAVFEQTLDAAGTKITRACQSSGRFETRLIGHIQERLK